ncbi:MFS transporter [Microlunatus sp. GCM10028923]|uniref:MFS transporter n=1 Tax=Microlunatus sp. GCM10028923 TaxID=3273400 RepID=UPI00361A7EBF
MKRTTSEPSLFRGPRATAVLAMLALVTLGALENRATSTVLPVLANELGGLTWFGAATTGPGLAYVVAVVLAGTWSDRRGPGPAILTGVGLFAVAQLVIAAAPSMIMVVAGRLLSGIAEGLFDIGITVLIVIMIPESQRPRMMSLIAMAWILPSVVGPQLAGWVAEWVGWRAVFLIGGALVLPVVLALLGPIRSAGGAPREQAERPAGPNTLPYAIAVAGTMGGAAALAPLADTGGTPMIIGAAALVVLVAIGIWCARPLLPSGTLALHRGLGATVGLGAVLSASFAVGSSYLPLMLIKRAGFSPAAAGLSLTVTGLFWAFGSWLQGSPAVRRRSTAVLRVRWGFTAIGFGLVAAGATALGVIPAPVGLAGWAVAGVGIGIASSSLSVHRLELAADAEQGRVAAGNGLLGSAMISAGGVAVGYAIAATAPEPPAIVFGMIFGVAAAAALAGSLLSGRIRPGSGTSAPVSANRAPSRASS